MAEDSFLSLSGTYLNPVYRASFPDPYVLKFCGEYYAYCTGLWKDGRVFGVLHSRNSIDWKELGGAMQPLNSGPPFYWAPEVTYDNGKFHLYYSAGNETLMEIRVAVSDRPGGGFIDSGKVLTSEEFAIDAHVFSDDDGRKYLFYATDFLTHTHIGTGTVIDEMIDPFTLAGNPRPVTRALYDWQVYDPVRREKGGVRWHTVEGPFVLKRKGSYYEMFSGGNWQNISYGVSFAVTDDLERNEEWKQFSDGEKVLPILRTIADAVVGPGHNSVIRGPNNRELYCIYHRWQKNERVLAIDRMDFAGDRIFIAGASHIPQIAPFLPSYSDLFGTERSTDAWCFTGDWSPSSGSELISKSRGCHSAAYGPLERSFLCEFHLRIRDARDKNSSSEFCLKAGEETVCKFLIFPEKRNVRVMWAGRGGAKKRDFILPENFAFDAFHLIRLEVDEKWVNISLDGHIVKFEETIDVVPDEIAFASTNARTTFTNFTLTTGFEDLFDHPNDHLEARNWQKLKDISHLSIGENQLFLSGPNGSEAIIYKGDFYENYEFAANVRLVENDGEDPAFGFLLQGETQTPTRISLSSESRDICVSSGANFSTFALPQGFDHRAYHQFRLLRIGDKIILQMEHITLGEILFTEKKTMVTLFCKNCIIAFDMVRLTVL